MGGLYTSILAISEENLNANVSIIRAEIDKSPDEYIEELLEGGPNGKWNAFDIKLSEMGEIIRTENDLVNSLCRWFRSSDASDIIKKTEVKIAMNELSLGRILILFHYGRGSEFLIHYVYHSNPEALKFPKGTKFIDFLY